MLMGPGANREQESIPISTPVQTGIDGSDGSANCLEERAFSDGRPVL